MVATVEAQGQGQSDAQAVTSSASTRSRYDLDTKSAAAYLGIKRGTLELWRSQRRNGIPFAKVGRRIYYCRADLDAFVAARVGTEPNAQRKRRP